MNNFFKISTLVLAVLLCLSILFSREVSIEKALKENENKGLKEVIKFKDIKIIASHEREKAKEAISFALQQRLDSAVKSSTTFLKLYQNEKKRHKTPILNDSTYTAVIDGLFPVGQ